MRAELRRQVLDQAQQHDVAHRRAAQALGNASDAGLDKGKAGAGGEVSHGNSSHFNYRNTNKYINWVQGEGERLLDALKRIVREAERREWERTAVVAS
jgi:hypothetical protein